MKTRIPLPVATSRTADHAAQRRAADARTTTPLQQMADQSGRVGLLQRLQADADGCAQGKRVTMQRVRSAEDSLARKRQRGEARKERRPIPKGRLQTPTGMTTVSNLFRQRVTQSRKEDYGGETFGGIPRYDEVVPSLPLNARPTLINTEAAVPIGLSNKERLATALVHTMIHGSEESRSPGTSSLFRALERDFERNGRQGDDPLSVTLFPARSTAKEQRDLMEGRTPLNAQQKRALEEDSAPSSDEEDEHFILRKSDTAIGDSLAQPAAATRPRKVHR